MPSRARTIASFANGAVIGAFIALGAVTAAYVNAAAGWIAIGLGTALFTFGVFVSTAKEEETEPQTKTPDGP